VPILTKRVIARSAICNSTAAPVAASVYLVPGQRRRPTPTNIMISARTIAPGEPTHAQSW
jgi:hypothetical protein